MLFYLLCLGCGGNETPPPKPAIPSCDAWADKVAAGPERIVLCSKTALTLRAEGKQVQAMVDRYSHALEAKGFTLERDVSRPSRVARVYARDDGRVAMAVMDGKDDTTVSFKVVP